MSVTRLSVRSVRVALSWRIAAIFIALLFAPVVLAAKFEAAASMNTARDAHMQTLLANGKVLAVGGCDANGNAIASAELYDPASNAWIPTASLANARCSATATPLPSGLVLVAGGHNSAGSSLTSVEIYDPAAGTWSAAAPMNTARYQHTATLLPSGKVLVIGGLSGSTITAATAAELYDPASNTWTYAAAPSTVRAGHTATLLANAKVLAAGGLVGFGGSLATAELYDPVANAWTSAGTMTAGHSFQTATLLPSGKVLVAAGGIFPIVSAVDIYDPAANSWSAAAQMVTARTEATASLLPSGKVIVMGGATSPSTVTGSAEIYDPGNNTWSSGGSLATARSELAATLLADGNIVVSGGFDGDATAFASVELYDPTTGALSAGPNMHNARTGQSATLLQSGLVLFAGGRAVNGAGNPITLQFAERYDPIGNTFLATTAALPSASAFHTAVLLDSGFVLTAGGQSGGTLLTNAQMFNPAGTNGSWSAAGNLVTPRINHTMTLLPSGKVLITGGSNPTNSIANVEIYDPNTNAWSAAASMLHPLQSHTATLLPSGKVLVVGGDDDTNTTVSSTEIYDPATNTWTAAASLVNGRASHSATLLASGKVLVTGGFKNGGYVGAAELYDPATNTWIGAGSLSVARTLPVATLLPSGKVLVTGGYNGAFLNTVDLYDPVTNTWSSPGTLSALRSNHSATLLTNSKVLIAGGFNALSGVGSVNVSTDLYDPGLAPDPTRQPTVTSLGAAFLAPTTATVVNGTGFQPTADGSSGATPSSPTNHPLLQVQRVDSGQMQFLQNNETIAFTNTTFTSTSSALAGFPAGPVMIRAWVNGIPSTTFQSFHATTPGAPFTPSAVGGTLQATVSFTAPRFNGGAPVTSYIATAIPGGVTQTCSAPCTQITLALDAGSYTFNIQAINAAGAGDVATTNSVFVTQPTTTLVVADINPSANGQSVTFTATVSGANPDGIGPVPTGTVTFNDGANPICSNVALNGSGQATCATSTLTPGTHTITVAYGGDNEDNPSTSDPLTDIVQAISAVALTSAPNPSIYSQLATFTATVTGLGPTGTVAFTDGVTTLCNSVALSSGVATCATSTLIVGQHSVVASYSGDTFNTGGTSPAVLQIVNQSPSTTFLLSTPNPSAYGHNVNFNATVQGVNPHGTVRFVDDGDGSVLCAGNDLIGGIAICPVATLNAGFHVVTAIYSGDTNNITSTSAGYFQLVNQATTTTLLSSSANPDPYGTTLTFTATVTGQSATGTVTFSDGIATLCDSAPLSGNTATCTPSPALAVGAYAISAIYSGDENNAPSTSLPILQTVQNGTSNVTLTTLCETTFVGGQPFTLNATVTANNPTGTVTFMANAGTTLCSNVALDNGSAACSTNALVATEPLDVFALTAHYSGDANNQPNTSSALNITVLNAAEAVMRNGFEDVDPLSCPIE